MMNKVSTGTLARSTALSYAVALNAVYTVESSEVEEQYPKTRQPGHLRGEYLYR